MYGMQALQELDEEYRYCKKCSLCENRTQVVFGSGASKAKLMIVGEAPGVEEDAEGMPFVGKSGRLLMNMLELAWPNTQEIARIRQISDTESYYAELREYLDDHIFWVNAVSCLTPEARTPTPKELEACRDRLERTIYAVDPLLILACGKTAATAVLQKSVQIVQKRGSVYDIHVKSPATGKEVRYTAMAILHPSYLLRKGDQTLVEMKKGDTYATLQDLKYALHLLGTHSKQLFGTAYP
jgi:uracil-DNA glycosylase family 4